MAFRSSTVNRASVKGDTPFNSPTRKINRRDILIYVTDYDLERGVICGTTVTEGRYVEASVDPQEVARGRETERKYPEKTSEAAYLGHSIDAKMKSRIEPNGQHMAILEGAEVQRKINKTINGTPTEIRFVRCRRVGDGGVNPKKTFEALITLTKNPRYNSVERVQCWRPEAFDIDNQEAIKELTDRLDKISAGHIQAQEAIQNGSKTVSYLPIVGAELRTIRMSDNPAEGGKIIDVSGRMERTPAIIDEATDTIITPSQPITGEIFKQNLKAYVDYVREQYGEDVRVEVSTYKSYPTGRYNVDFDFNEMRGSYSPFLQMASARSRVAADDEEMTEGGNYGGWGVVSISKDRVDEQGNVDHRYYVNRVYVSSNAKAFIHRKVKSADGMAYDLDNALKGPVLRWKDAQQANQNTVPVQNSLPKTAPQPAGDIPFEFGGENNTKPVQTKNEPAPQPAPTSTTANDPWGNDNWNDDDDIPFDSPPPSVTRRGPGM